VSGLRRYLGPGAGGLRRTLITGAVFVVGFIIVGVIGIQVWEYSNSVAFCSNVCHAVHPEEPAAFRDSYHAQVRCVECHMGRLGTLQSIALKTTHARELPEMIFHTYERPLRSATLRPANESCERCHWPPAFHGDRVDEIRHYKPDETNTLTRTFLILKTGGGQRDQGLGGGIHWHIENPVQYIATDDTKQEIRWVRTTLPDGRVMEYNDVLHPLAAEDIAKATKQTMDCVDCHNRAGHPFPSPEKAVDQALTQGRLSPDLPFIEQNVVALLSASYSTRDAALQAADGFMNIYEQGHPGVLPAQQQAVQQASAEAKQLMLAVTFAQPGVSWRSFPDNAQHKDFPGCFRCHDGKHMTADGKESIRLQCNLCHDIPIVVGAGDRPPAMPVVTVQEPASHLATTWMATHRFEASDQACSGCHGKIVFGTDNSNFCSNSACHGQSWPSVQLDAAFPHPIPLVGAHAKVWCNDCHKGVEKPEYKCANCHQAQAPANHFTAACDSCHTPEGWTQSAAGVVARSPKIPHPLQGRDQCLTCHDPAGQVKPAPADHVGRTNAQCGLCHKPAGST
jgi:hypothetical protein